MPAAAPDEVVEILRAARLYALSRLAERCTQRAAELGPDVRDGERCGLGETCQLKQTMRLTED